MHCSMSAGGKALWVLFVLLSTCTLAVIAVVDIDFIVGLHNLTYAENDTDPTLTKRDGRSISSNFEELQLDNQVDKRSSKSLLDDVQNVIEEFIKKGFAKAEEIIQQQKDAVATTRSNFLQFHAPIEADVSIKHASDCRGLGILETSKLVAEHFKIPKNEAEETLRAITIPAGICRSIEEKCSLSGRHLSRQLSSRPRTCNMQAKYRTIDGTCNNPNNARLGASGTVTTLLLAPAYADGVNSPRVAISGKPLPNSRVISNAMFDTNPNPPTDGNWTQLLKGWGQFLDHDITRTPESVVLDNNGHPQSISCCDSGRWPNFATPPDCMPINVTQDKFYRSNGIQCLRFVRSMAADCDTCNLGVRTQVNANTHYIDASHIYGSNSVDQRNLRSFRGGRLQISKTFVEPGGCPGASSPCQLSFLHQQTIGGSRQFVSGDARLLEQPGLTCLHTVFLRYHNRLADALAQLNPQWNDETIYQECRRIIAALIQQISYSEFLPIVLGKKIMQEHNIVPVTRAFFNGYDSSVDPSISSVFSTAAYRFGHTLIGNNLMGANRRLIPLKFVFNDNAVTTIPGQFPSEISIGEWILDSESNDVHFASAVKNFLFASGPSFKVGLDLMAANIMRGRDHGTPSYNEWRKFCGLEPFSSFEHLINSGELINEAARAFARVYKSTEDIDLYVGGLAEKEAESGFLGPTFACLVGLQFKNLRVGDRFWYENGNMPTSFTIRQMVSLKRTTLAAILCETLASSRIQPFPMLGTIIPGNSVRPCSTITANSLLKPQNIAAWKV